MSTNVHDSYRIIVLLGLLVSVSLSPSAGYSQQAAKLDRVQFTGLKKLSADQAIALCDERGFHEIGLWAKGEQGWALAQLGRVDEGLALARDALAVCRGGSA